MTGILSFFFDTKGVRTNTQNKNAALIIEDQSVRAGYFTNINLYLFLSRYCI